MDIEKILTEGIVFKGAKSSAAKKEEKVKLQTNPIVKKLARFHLEKPETFSVKDLFKK